MVLLRRLKDSLELFVKRGEFLLGSGFQSRRDITQADESDVKPFFSFICHIIAPQQLS